MTAPMLDAMAARLIEEGAPPDSAKLAAGVMLDRLQYPEGGGSPIVVDKDGLPALAGNGSPVTVSDLLASLRIEIPQLFGTVRQAATTSTPPAGETMTARVAREHREAMARRDRQAASGEAPNPWHPSSISVTQQVLIASRDPERAAKLKAEAGGR